MITMNKSWLLAGFFLLVMIFCTGPVHAGPVTVFSDDFNDNSLDTGKWTADVVGTNNAFREQNQRAEFTTYGPAGGGYHCFLNSMPIEVNGWDSIEITGKWTNTGYTSRTHIAKITDLESPANFISIEYAAWDRKMFYFWKDGSSSAGAPVPSPSLVPFRFTISKTGFEYYENNVLLKSIPTSSMANAERFQLHIGAWEYSRITSKTYIDEIVVQVNYPPQNDPVLNDPVSAPEFPSAFLPVMFIIGILGTVFSIRSTRKS